MDFVTHAATGALVGRALAPTAAPAGVSTRLALVGALASLLPDADHALELVSAEAYLLHHRTASHALVVLGALAALALAWPARADGPGRGRRAAVVGCSFAVHLLLDLMTPFGTGIGWPFTAAMPALDGLPLVAPWMLGTSALLALWARRRAGSGPRPARLALAGVGLVLALHAASSWRAAGAVPGATLAHADAPLPLRARAVRVEGPDAVYFRVGLDGAAREVERVARVQGGPDGPGVEAARRAAAPLLARLRLPLATWREGGLLFQDGQFLLLPGGASPLRVIVELDGEAVRAVRSEQDVRGLQLLVWAAVALACGLLARRPAPAAGPAE